VSLAADFAVEAVIIRNGMPRGAPYLALPKSSLLREPGLGETSVWKNQGLGEPLQPNRLILIRDL
jgi:hypothetical protein